MAAGDDGSWVPPRWRGIGLTQREFRERERERRIHERVRAPAARQRGRARGRNRGLTRADIVAAAVALADVEGVDAVSMRRLAGDLRAGAMSLYWHIESKEELLELMLDRMEGEILAPEASGDWRSDLRGYATTVRAVLMRHPWAVDLMFARPPSGPNDARNGDRIFGIFLGLGVQPRTAIWLAMAYFTYVIGAVQQQIREVRVERDVAAATADMTADEMAEMQQEFVRRFRDSGEYPSIARIISEDIDPDDPATRDERFEFGLEVMLDGIAAQLPVSGDHRGDVERR